MNPANSTIALIVPVEREPSSVRVIAAADRDAVAKEVGPMGWSSPPPPGVRAALVWVCVLGTLLSVLLMEHAAHSWSRTHMSHETATDPPSTRR